MDSLYYLDLEHLMKVNDYFIGIVAQIAVKIIVWFIIQHSSEIKAHKIYK